jgi:hypothetical protein
MTSQSLCDEWIKQAMEKIAREERPMQTLRGIDTTSSSTTSNYLWGEPRKYVTEKAKAIIEEKEEVKQDPQFFDPKELDIDVDK